MWYRTGSVTVTNGSNIVTGAGTDFVANASIGDAFVGPDGRSYEITQIVSATDLRLTTTYQAATGGGQAYAIQPTQSYIRDLALQAGSLLNSFGAVRDGIGKGNFPDGSVPLPAFRFTADQDTGFTRLGDNQLGIVAGGIVRLMVDTSGNILIGGTSGNGNAPNAHRVAKVVSQAQGLLAIDNNDGTSALFLAVEPAGNVSTAVPAAVLLGRNTGNNRSASATGTINASGADYAEYMVKSTGCGTIAQGDVCGVTVDGLLTKTWADALSFIVKSTDPSLVGGDTWAAHLPPRPTQAADETSTAFASRLAKWEADLEAARQCVDRIAFCGQVPCNVSGDFEVGDYIVAAASGAGIKAVAMKLDDMTLAQYARRIGKVWAVRDGRAWIDVQHG